MRACRHLVLVAITWVAVRSLVPGTRPAPCFPVTAWLAERAVMLDPGHGGYDPGVVGPGGEVEKDIALDVALRTRELLAAAGLTVLMTRETDCDLADPEEADRLGSRKRSDLEARLRMTRNLSPDVFVSIHVNSYPSSRWWGAQTFYYPGKHPDSARLAACIQDELRRIPGSGGRRPNPRTDQFLLKQLEIPAVTVELGFVSNPGDARRLMDDVHRESLAWAIFSGLVRYFLEASPEPD